MVNKRGKRKVIIISRLLRQFCIRCNPKYYYYLIWNSKNYKAIKRYAGKQEWKELPEIPKTELQGYKKGYKKKGVQWIRKN